MGITPSIKVGKFKTGIFSELADRKADLMKIGRDIIDLSVGSPDLPPPLLVRETLAKYVQDPASYGYTLKGTAEFQEAVCTFYHHRYGVELDSKQEVLQLMGSQDGLAHLATAIVNPGDYVLVPDPGYPIYEASVTLAGGELYPMPLTEENHYLPQLDEIPENIARKAKMMIMSYPGNPVTALADESFFKKAVAFAKRHEILVVHDFAYSELILEGNPPISFLSVPGAKEVGIEFNSLSKTFNMAGCRIGYAVGNPQALGILGTLKSQIDYGVFYPIQKAAAAALTADYAVLAEQVSIYEARRDVLLEGLAEGGWPVGKTNATMFVWARIPDGWNAQEFAYDLMEKAGVIVVPGDAFGRQGEGFVRIALVQPKERLREAAERIGLFLAENQKVVR